MKILGALSPIPFLPMNLVTIGMFSPIATVRSLILSYGYTKSKHVYRVCDPSTYKL